MVEAGNATMNTQSVILPSIRTIPPPPPDGSLTVLPLLCNGSTTTNLRLLSIYTLDHYGSQRGLCYIQYMGERSTSYYLLESTSYSTIERVWNYVQSTHDHMYMYKARISSTSTAWVIQMPCDRLETMFLLQFSSYVTSIHELG